MENSRLSASQDIEQLKQKIVAYRDTLTALKMGTSMEDYLFMKNEFDELKTQIAHLEGLTETMDEKQSMQIGGYEKQVKQFSGQLDSLNQTVEEMNQKILSVLNQFISNEDHTQANNEHAPIHGNTSVNTRKPHIKPTEEINRPSYRQLQSMAGKAIVMQKNQDQDVPATQQANHEIQLPQRHFNQQYFQSTNSHPSHIYNGLYRNSSTQTNLHFKHAVETQGIPVSVVENAKKTSSAITNASEKIATPPPKANESTTTMSASPIIDASEHTLSPTSIAGVPEATGELDPDQSNQTGSSKETMEGESKKEKHSLFFNIFRKRN